MTATIRFREGTLEDRDAILALRKLVFPEEHQEKQDPRFWEWEFTSAEPGRGRWFVAEAEGRVVGHTAFVRQRFLSRETLKGAIQVDVMTDPRYRRLKVYSRLAAFATESLRGDVEFITAFQIRRAVLPGALAGGLRAKGIAPVLIRPLSLRNAVRHLVTRTVPPRALRETPLVREIRDSELAQVDLLLQTDAVRQPRTPAFLRWRYQQNPAWRYGLEGFFENGQLQAFIVHRRTTLRGVPALAIADAGLLPGSDEPFRTLLSHVCTNGRLEGAVVAASLLTPAHPAWGALRRGGFFSGPHRFRLLLQAADSRFDSLESDPWSLSWGDTDHL